MTIEKQKQNKTESVLKTELTKNSTSVVAAFLNATEKKEAFFQFWDDFSIPIEIFAADGTTVYHNKAGYVMNGVKDANLICGVYNLVKDPVCNDQLGIRDEVEAAFRGETVIVRDFPAPIQDLIDRKVIEEKPWETSNMDVYFSPVLGADGKLAYVVCAFVIKSVHKGRHEIAKAREYIENNWLDEFDLKVIAKAVNLNASYFSRLFKQQTGESVFEYYKKIKIKRLKEKLRDPSLNITEAFAACGMDYTGRYAGYFHEIVGISPSDYRKDKLKKE